MSTWIVFMPKYKDFKIAAYAQQALPPTHKFMALQSGFQEKATVLLLEQTSAGKPGRRHLFFIAEDPRGVNKNDIFISTVDTPTLNSKTASTMSQSL
jgi:hypothetical protein